MPKQKLELTWIGNDIRPRLEPRILLEDPERYVPDFAVETADACYLCEPKRVSDMDDPVVRSKAQAAALWCQRATEHSGSKPWKYLFIPHDSIDESKTVAGLAARHLVFPAAGCR